MTVCPLCFPYASSVPRIGAVLPLVGVVGVRAAGCAERRLEAHLLHVLWPAFFGTKAKQLGAVVAGMVGWGQHIPVA